MLVTDKAVYDVRAEHTAYFLLRFALNPKLPEKKNQVVKQMLLINKSPFTLLLCL